MLNIRSPIFNPLGLPANGEDTAGTFALESTNLVGTHAFREPERPGCGNIFTQAVIEENFASDTVRDSATETAQRDQGISKVTKPGFSLGVCQSDPGWGLESTACGDCSIGLSLIEG